MNTRKKRIFFGLSSFQFLAMFRRGVFYTYLSIYLKDFLQLQITLTTLYATLPMIVSVIAQTIIWGYLSDKLQRRRSMMMTGELLAAILILIVYLIHKIASGNLMKGWAIILGLTVVEFFWSMSNVGWSALISDLYLESERAEKLAYLNSVGAIGGMAGVSFGGFFYDGFGKFYDGWGFYEGALFYIVAIVIVISILPLLFLPEGGIHKNHLSSCYNQITPISNKKDNNEKGEMKLNNINIEKRESLLNEEIQKIRLRYYSIFIVSLIFINFGYNSIVILFPQYFILNEAFKGNSNILANILNMRSLSVIFLGLFIGAFCKKLGNVKTFIIGVLLGIISLWLIPLTNFIYILYFSMFLRGIAETIINSASYGHVSSFIPAEQRGKYFSYYNLTFFLSWGVATTFISAPIIDLLIGLGYSEIYSYKISFYIAIILVLVGLIIFIFLEFILRKNKQLKQNKAVLKISYDNS